MDEKILEVLKHYDFSKDVPEEIEEKINKLLDYITNLQDKYNEALECIDELKNEVDELNKICDLYGKSLYNAELTDYKSKIDKATEIYKNRNTCKYKKERFMKDKSTSDLMYEALQGSDTNE